MYVLVFEQPNMEEIMIELNGKPSSVTTFSANFSFQNLVFKILLNFQQ